MITINDCYQPRSATLVLTLAMCRTILLDSEGTTIAGGHAPGHPLMHTLMNGGYGHLGPAYLERDTHSMFATLDDAVTALLASLTSAGGAKALGRLRGRRGKRAAVFASAEAGAEMRILMATPIGMPMISTAQSAASVAILDLDTANSRLHVQTFYPTDDIVRELKQFGGKAGPAITSAAFVEPTIYAFSGPFLSAEYQAVNTADPLSGNLRQRWNR